MRRSCGRHRRRDGIGLYATQRHHASCQRERPPIPWRAHLRIRIRVPVDCVRAVARDDEVVHRVRLEVEAVADERVGSGVELDDRVLEPARLEGDDRCACDKELLLHNTPGLKHGRHHAEVGAEVDHYVKQGGSGSVCAWGVIVA